MNDRYLFRGKRKDNGEWMTGYYVCLNENCHRIYIGYAEKDCGDYYPEYFEVIPGTVGQSTGLKDKNGKWIFEGDVVNALLDFGMPIKSVCTFKDGSFGLLSKQHDTKHFTPFTSLCNVNYEVVANIHDNPELLEVER